MLGKPRTKGEAELAWSRVKRAITASVNYEAQVWREEELNKRLDKAWNEFKSSLLNDELMEAELPALGPGRE